MPARRNARKTRYCIVPRVIRSPSAATNSASPSAGERFFVAAGIAGAAVTVLGQNSHQRSLNRDAAIFAFLARHLQDRAVGGGPDVVDVGTHQLVGRSLASSGVKMTSRSRSVQSLCRCSGSAVRVVSSATAALSGNDFGRPIDARGRPT
jgi:hypothetical protein